MRPTFDLTRAARIGALLSAVLTVPAAAGDAADCYGAPDLGGPVSLARVAAEGRVPFLKSAGAKAGCPDTTAACRDKAYLVAGNRVVRGPAQGGFVCATYVGATGDTRSGWLPAAALADEAPVEPALADWVGTWTSGPEQTVAITRKGAGLALSGTASYGAQDPDRVRRGAVNMGSFEATVRPDGPRLAFTDGETGIRPVYSPDDGQYCSVRMRLLPPFLVAESTAACGGMNVSFTGVYRRGG